MSETGYLFRHPRLGWLVAGWASQTDPRDPESAFKADGYTDMVAWQTAEEARAAAARYLDSAEANGRYPGWIEGLAPLLAECELVAVPVVWATWGRPPTHSKWPVCRALPA